MYNPISERAKERHLLLAAHRGCCGGNIPCNSLAAYQIALNSGADIVEIDVENSADGKLFIQHPGMERIHLRFGDSIRNYSAQFIEQMKLSNSEWIATQYPILRLEEVLDELKGKCIVNIDKFWRNPEPIAKLVRERGMQDQVLLKTSLKETDVSAVEQYASDLPFMPMVKEEDHSLEQFRSRNLRYVGSEALFQSESAPVCSPEYIETMHRAGKCVWANAIVYNYKTVLSAGHTDDISLLEAPEKGWGWLADRGFDIIQTDWLMHCDTWLKSTGRRI